MLCRFLEFSEDLFVKISCGIYCKKNLILGHFKSTFKPEDRKKLFNFNFSLKCTESNNTEIKNQDSKHFKTYAQNLHKFSSSTFLFSVSIIIKHMFDDCLSEKEMKIFSSPSLFMLWNILFSQSGSDCCSRQDEIFARLRFRNICSQCSMKLISNQWFI